MSHEIAFTIGVKGVPVLFGDVSVELPVIHFILKEDVSIDFGAIAKSPAHFLQETKVSANVAYVDVETKLRDSSDDADIFAVATTKEQAPFCRFRLHMEGMEYNWWKNCRRRALGRWSILYEWEENFLLVILNADGSVLSTAERIAS